MKKNGFTIIEMLVVISVIILLVTLLLPSLERSFEIANRAVCASNLKSAGGAAQLYKSTFGFYPPNWTWGKQGEAPANYNKYEKRNGWDGQSSWLHAKNPLYPEFIKSLDIFVCPSNVNTVLVDDPKDIDPEQPLDDLQDSKNKLKGYHIRYDNGRVFYFYEWNHNLSKILGYARIESGTVVTTRDKPKDANKWHVYWWTNANPSEPARTYVYYESDDDGEGKIWDGSNHPRILSGTQGEADSGGNIVFADGSVRWLTNSEKTHLELENIVLNRDKQGNSLKYGVYSNPYNDDALSNVDRIHKYQARN